MGSRSENKLRREFRDYFLVSSLPSLRIGLFITLTMFALFAAFNELAFPGSEEQEYYKNFLVVAPVMIAAIIISWIRPLHKWMYFIFIGLNILISAGVFYVGLKTDLSQKGSESYFAWVMLVVIGLFVFFKLPPLTTILIGLLLVLAFISANVFNHTLEQKTFYFFNNLFFILAIYSIGFILAVMYRTLNWKNFLHQKALSRNNAQLSEEIRERKQAVEAFQRSELQYHSTLDAIPDWIYVVDRRFRIMIINSALKEGHRTYGLPVNVVGKSLTEVYPFISELTVKELQQVFDYGSMLVTEQIMNFGDSRTYMEIRKIPVFSSHEVVQVMTILRDRSKEREVDELKQKNAEQKEIMLREIHHRVKNNLAIVISLLSLQLRNNPDPELKRIICDIEMRIRSMALIHEHLYRSENIDRIPLAAYLNALATIIMGTFSGNRVSLVTRLEPTDVSIETALPLGLIANELLTNAFKYAFPDNRDGEIRVNLLKEEGEFFKLTISDNGIGLPEDFSLNTEKSLGMFIVKLLVEQLDGSIEITRDHGASFSVLFRNLIMASQET